MYAKPYFKKGTHNRICDECGFLFKRSQLRRRYDGNLVCYKDWEPRHESEYPKKIRTRHVRIDTNDDNVATEIFDGFILWETGREIRQEDGYLIETEA